MRKDAEQVNGSAKLKETIPALSAYLSHDLTKMLSDKYGIDVSRNTI